MRLRSGFNYILILPLLALLVSPALGKIIYVDDDAPAPGDGTSWTTAYRYLQDALADANDSEQPIEIRVAQGTYKPDRSSERPAGTGDRGASFQISNGVTVKGGYYGQGEGFNNTRDIELYESILSGDLTGNDAQVVDPRTMTEDPKRAENSYRVVTISGTHTDVVIDGFNIAGGHADPCIPTGHRGSARSGEGEGIDDGGNLMLSNCTFAGNFAHNGGALRISGGTPILTDCIFHHNRARDGGALYISGGTPTLVRCILHNNLAHEKKLRLPDGTVLGMYGRGGGIYANSGMILEDCEFYDNLAASGGAMHINGGNDLVLTHCAFNGNVATRVGGGMRSEFGNHLSLIACEFRENSAGRTGGAIFSLGDVITLTHCLFSGNSADREGGGIYGSATDLILNNCTSAGNRTLEGSALAFESSQTNPSTAQLTHCILWDSGNQLTANGGTDLMVAYSAILGGWPGEGNIDVAPLFADPGYWDANGTADDPNDDFFVEGDYHLMSEAGRWDPNVGAWVRDEVTSPCVDAGDPNSEVGDEVWPHGGRINMGAYGGTREASLSIEPSDMFLPRVACIYWHNSQLAESCQLFLQTYGCSVTLIRSEEIIAHPMDDYDLILIATDTPSPAVWSDEQTVAALAESGKPVLGLGEGGYVFFGQLGLNIGYPNGARTTFDSIQIVDPNEAISTTPYPVTVPDDGILQLLTSPAQYVVIHLWPAPPEGVTIFAGNVDSVTYCPLVTEQGHLLWGFKDAPEKMTQAGQRLFLNATILTANERLE